MTDPASPSEQLGGFDRASWWTISSEALMDMLYAVHNGRAPESVYVEAYNNASREQPEA